jgi:excisionase family DNA binding protein
MVLIPHGRLIGERIMEDRLTLQQASELLGVSEMTVRRHIKSGKIKAVQQYNRYLINKDDLPIPKEASNKMNNGYGCSLPQLEEESNCDCTCDVTCIDHKGPSSRGELRLSDAIIITRYIYMIVGYKMLTEDDEVNDLFTIIYNQLHSVGLDNDDLKNDNKIIVTLQKHPRLALEIYNEIRGFVA